MKRSTWFSMGMALTAMFAGAAQAEQLLASRLVADDVPALAKFYQAAFDMKQVNRFDMSNGLMEIMLNFGDTVDAAKANRAATQLVISSRQANDGSDKVAHLVFSVADMAATLKKFKAAGGKFEREPTAIGASKTMMAIGIDPAGNHVEVLYLEPKK
jgi:predicted enzyme related to lactoylglutathione lyase